MVYTKIEISEIENDSFAVFKQNLLGSHNEFRRRHGSPPLKWNLKLETQAEACAFSAARTNVLRSVDMANVGQNVIAKTSGALKGEHVSFLWYEEEKNYDYASPGFKTYTGSFTQMIWKDTEEIGIGRAFGNNGETFVVALYSPPGNIKHKYKENVKPLDENFYDERFCNIL